MTAYSRHNKYVSIPDWFESVNKTETTTHDVVTSKGILVVGTSAVSNTLSDITLYNKFITVDSEINIDHLTIENTALSAVDPIGNLIPETGWKCSNYITVAANTTMIVKSTIHDKYGIVFYDNTLTAINGNTITSDTQNVEVPSNAFYFKICCDTGKTADFLVQYKSYVSYNEEQLEISNQNISDYLALNEELKEGYNQIVLNESSIKLLVQNPILLTKDLNGIIKLSLDYNNIEGFETSEMFEWDKSSSAFGYDPISKTAYSYINGVQQFTTDSDGNQIPVMTDNREFWEYDPNATDKWVIRALKPRLSLFNGLMEYDEELDAFFFHKHIVTSGGLTMYAKDEFINVPLIFDSLPIDGKTIKWAEVNNDGIISKVLTAEVDDLVTTLGELTNVGGWANDIPEEDRVIVQKANESNWSSVLVKDLEGKTSFKNVFQSGEGNAYTDFKYVPDDETLTFIKEKSFVTTDAEKQNIEGIKTFLNGLKIGNSIIKESSTDIIYVDANLVVKGGVTVYSSTETPEVPSIFDGLPIDWNTLVRDSEGTLMINPNIKLGGISNWDEINGKPHWLQDDKIEYTEIEGTPDLTEYASKSDLLKVLTKVDDFLEGSDTNGIIDKWKELEIFLLGLDYSPDLAEILSTKADKGTTLADYGITDAYTKDEVNTQLKKYVTIDGNEDVTGVHDFVNGLKIGGIELSESLDNVLRLDGNLVVKGGITIYGFDNVTASSIMEALKLDSNTLEINSRGELTVIGGIGGASSWDELQGKPDTISGYGITDAYISNGVITLGNNEITPLTDTELTEKLDLYLPIAGGTMTGAIVFPIGSALSSPSIKWGEVSQMGVNEIGNTSIITKGAFAVITGYEGDASVNFRVDASGATGIANSLLVGTTGVMTGDNYAFAVYGDSWFRDSITVGMDIMPRVTNTTNLGSSDKMLANLYTTQLNIDGIEIYKSQDDVLYLDGNLIVRGGVTMYGNDSVTASTIMDAIKVDNTTIHINADGELEVIGGTGGGLDLVALEDYLVSNKYLTLTNGDGRYLLKSTYTASDILTKLKTVDGASSGLDADLLDGLQGSSYARSYGGASVDASLFGIGYDNSSNGSVGLPMSGGFISATQGSYGMQLLGNAGGDHFYFRGVYNKAFSDWKQIAFTDSNITGNAATATTASKLSTVSKTAWGQTYWTSGGVPTNISGNMSNVGNITFNSDAVTVGAWGTGIHAIYANLVSSGGNNRNLWLIGSSSDSSYGIVFARNTTGTGTGEIARMNSASFHPYTSGGLALGTSSNRWGGIYSTTGNFSGKVTAQSGMEGSYWKINDTSTNPYLMLNQGSIWYVQGYGGYLYMGAGSARSIRVDSSGNLFTPGGVTMYSDIRKKTKLNDVELTLKQVANAPLIEHYYNDDEKKTTHVGTIAQYWAEDIGNEWFCKKDDEGFYTMEIQNAALASAISVARELSRFEDETDKRLRILEEENKKLKEELLIYKSL